MKNLKKLIAVVIVVAMMATAMMPAFAANESFSYNSEAEVLHDLGLYKGTSTDPKVFNPDLGSALTREAGVVMLLRLFALESEAVALADEEVDQILGDFSDAAEISSWARNSVAYAVANKLVLGFPDGTFGPNQPLLGKAYCTLILRQLGYNPDYANAASQLVDKGGLTEVQANKFNDQELIRDDLVGISFGSLKATYSEGSKTVIETLVAAGVVEEAKAVANGLMDPVKPPVTITALATVAPITVKVGQTPTLPATIKATYSDETQKDVTVTWGAVDTTKAGKVTVQGSVEGTDLKATVEVTVEEAGLVASVAVANDTTDVSKDKVTVTFKEELTTAPVAADFTVTRTVNGTADTTALTPASVSFGATNKVVTFTVPAVAAGDADKTVVYGVAYKTQPAVNAAALTVAKIQSLTVTTVTGTDALSNTGIELVEGVAPFESLVMTMSGDVDTATITTANITVIDSANISQSGAVTYDAAKKQITYTLNNNQVFASNKEFTLTVANLKDTAGKVMTTYAKKFKTGNQFVVSNPKEPANTNMTATSYDIVFNKDIDLSTATTGTVKIFNVTDSVYVADNNGVISLNGTTGISIDPGAWTANKDYRIELSGSIKALDGTSLGQDVKISYSTQAAWAPAGKTALIGAVSRAIGGATTANVNGNLTSNVVGDKLGFVYKIFTVTDLDTATVSNDTIYLKRKDTGVKVDATTAYDATSKMITIAPKEALTQEKTYQLVVSTSVKTAKGKALANEYVSDEFTTGDYTRPFVKSTSVNNGATVSLGDNLDFFFSELMAAQATSFIYDNGAGTWNNGGGTGTATIKVTDLSVSSTADIDVTGWTTPNVSTTPDNVSKVRLALPSAETASFKKGHTYKITFKGYNSEHARNVVDDTAVAVADNGLASDYTFTVTIAGADTTAPIPGTIKAASGSDLNGSTNIPLVTKFTVAFDDEVVINPSINMLADISTLAGLDVNASATADTARVQALTGGTTTVPTLASTAMFYAGDKVLVLDASGQVVNDGAITANDTSIVVDAAGNITAGGYIAFAANEAGVDLTKVYKVVSVDGTTLNLDRKLGYVVANAAAVIHVQPKTIISVTANTNVTLDSAIKAAPAGGTERIYKVRGYVTKDANDKSKVVNLVYDMAAADTGERSVTIASANLTNTDLTAGSQSVTSTFKAGVGPKFNAYNTPNANYGTLAATSTAILVDIDVRNGVNNDNTIAAAALNDSNIVVEKQDGSNWVKVDGYTLSQNDPDANANDDVDTITITPSSAGWASSATLRVTLKSTLTDGDGNKFQVGNAVSDFQFFFKTPDGTAPNAPTFSGLTNNLANTKLPTVTVTFNEKVAVDNGGARTAVTDTNAFMLFEKSDYATNGTAATAIAIDVKADSNATPAATGHTVYTITPEQDLTAGNSYVVVAIGDGINANSVGITDIAGNDLAANASYTFTVDAGATAGKAPKFMASIWEDANGVFPAGAAEITETVPGNAQYVQNADGEDYLGFEFDEAVNVDNAVVTVTDMSDASASNISVLPLSTSANLGGGNEKGMIVKFGPEIKAHIYKIVVSKVKDADGNVTPDFTVYLTGNTTN